MAGRHRMAEPHPTLRDAANSMSRTCNNDTATSKAAIPDGISLHRSGGTLVAFVGSRSSHSSSTGGDGMVTNEDTVRSYDVAAAEYVAEVAAMPEWVAGEIDAFVDALAGTGRILEIGSGGGRDARELERRGLSVRCTDVAQGFVDLLRADGRKADRLDPLTDDLADPQHPDTPYDGVWSCACLFHVARADLVTVLGRLAEATRFGGRIHASFKEGNGEDRSTSGTTDATRSYTDTLWREPELRSQFSAAGWVVDEVGSHGDKPWLAVRGHRP